MAGLNTEDKNHLEPRAQSPERLLSAQSSRLTPPTPSSPPPYNAQASPVVDTRLQPPSYATTSTPIVCCRAGFRPANITAASNEQPPFVAPQEKDDQPTWQHEKTGSAYDPEAAPQEHHRRIPGRWRESKTSRRWLTALALITGLFLLHRSFSGPGFAASLDKHSRNGFTQTFDKVDNFSFWEAIPSEAHLSPKGIIRIEPAPHDQVADIAVSVSYSASWPYRVVSTPWSKTDSSLRLETPTVSTKFPNPFGSRLSITASIYIQPSLSLQTLSIYTGHLAVASSPLLFHHCRSNLNIETTAISACHQPIDLPTWTSRKTTLHTISSPITGTFKLLDLLSLSSQSGSISATVIPGEAEPSHPTPAYLKVSTDSGSVDVSSSSIHDPIPIPDREYHSSVSTASGSIKGRYLLGVGTSLTTQSGSINADFVPFGSRTARLETASGSGATHARVLSGEGGKDVDGLRSEHKSSGSGSVNVLYPVNWEGRITGTSGSGSIRVSGPEIIVDESSRGQVRAHKGDEKKGNLEVRTGSGSVDVNIS